MEQHPKYFGEYLIDPRSLIKDLMERHKTKYFSRLEQVVKTRLSHYEREGKTMPLMLRRSLPSGTQHFELEVDTKADISFLQIREFTYRNIGLSESFVDRTFRIYKDGTRSLQEQGLDYEPGIPIMFTEPSAAEEREFVVSDAKRLARELEAGDLTPSFYGSGGYKLAVVEESVLRKTVSGACQAALHRRDPLNE